MMRPWDTVLHVAWTTYANLSATAEDAAASGIAELENQSTRRQISAYTYDKSGGFNPLDVEPNYATCEGDQNCSSSSQQNACNQDGYYMESGPYYWRTVIAESHMDYGGKTGFRYGGSADSTFTVGVKAGSGSTWSAGGGYDHISGKHAYETSWSPVNSSGNGWTRERYTIRVGHGLYVSKATRYENGDTSRPYCDSVYFVHALGRDPGESLSIASNDSGSANPPKADRCWTTCASGRELLIIQQPEYVLEVARTKASYVTAGVNMWGYLSAQYQSGQSSLAERKWIVGSNIVTGGCAGGWHTYWDGNTRPNEGTPNAFFDAGDPGSGVTGSKPTGC